jgi:predicted nucleic acid-binding protein
MDERRGRAVARGKELSVLGTGGLLLAAKKQGAIESVRSALDSLLDAGYRMAPSLRDRVLELAGEA